MRCRASVRITLGCRMKMRMTRRIVVILLGSTAFLLACRFLLPCPIVGNWTGGRFFAICGCDTHRFLRFHDGLAVTYGEGSKSCLSIPYRKIGWNKFRYDMPAVTWSEDRLHYTLDTNSFWTVRPGWFTMEMDVGDDVLRLTRDIRVLRARSIVASNPTFRTWEATLDRAVERRRIKQMEAAQHPAAHVFPKAANGL